MINTHYITKETISDEEYYKLSEEEILRTTEQLFNLYIKTL